MSSWGTGILSVFSGAGEELGSSMKNQAIDKRKETVEAAKARALEAKQKNLMYLQNELAINRQDKQNAFNVGQTKSGFRRDGHEITKAEYDALDEESRKGLVTTDEYNKSLAEQEMSKAKELADYKHRLDTDLASHKAGLKADSDKYTPSELKYMKENALNSLSARLKSKGAIIDDISGEIVIPTDKDGNPDMEVLKMLDQSGFEFSTGRQFKEDKKGLFTGNNHYMTVNLGGFNPSRINSSPYEHPQQASGGSRLDSYLGRVKNNGNGAQQATPTQPQPSRNQAQEPKTGLLEKESAPAVQGGTGDVDSKGQYTNIIEKDGVIWGEDTSGKTRRIIVKETPVYSSGLPNNSFPAYVEKMKALGLNVPESEIKKYADAIEKAKQIKTPSHSDRRN